MQERVRPAGAAVPPPPLTADQFLAFWETRPDDERWELVDGVPCLMTPPTILHERIAHSLRDLLRDALAGSRPDLWARLNAGLMVPGREDFRATCDVAITPQRLRLDALYTTSFLLAAEVRSKSNTARKIEQKRRQYMQGPDVLHVLVLQQKKLLIEHWARADGWHRRVLDQPSDRLELAEIGFACTLGEIYRDTPLVS